MRYLNIIVTILFLLLVVAACSGAADEQSVNMSTVTSPADNNGGNNVSVGTSPEGMVAIVNGTGIPQVHFDRALARVQTGSTATDPIALKAQVLDTLIEQEIINQAATNMGITVTDAQIDEEINLLKSSLNGALTWEEWLRANGYNEVEFRQAVYEQLLTTQVRGQLESELLGTVAQVRARHILVPTQDEANAVEQRLNNGEDFAVVAQAVSLDASTRDSGGDLGWFTREELIDSSLADVAFSLQVGQRSEPVPTRLGYHILETLEFGDRAIEPERLPMLMENRFLNWLSQQVTNASIETFSS